MISEIQCKFSGVFFAVLPPFASIVSMLTLCVFKIECFYAFQKPSFAEHILQIMIFFYLCHFPFNVSDFKPDLPKTIPIFNEKLAL